MSDQFVKQVDMNGNCIACHQPVTNHHRDCYIAWLQDENQRLEKLSKGEEDIPTWDVDWLVPGWIAMDSDGEWYWYAEKPTIDSDNWGSDKPATSLIRSFIADNAIPESMDWKKSLHSVNQPKG